MSLKQLKKYFNFSIYFHTLVLVIIVAIIIFSDFVINHYLINDLNHEIVTVRVLYQRDLELLYRENLRNKLEEMQKCVYHNMLMRARSKKISSYTQFDELAKKILNECSTRIQFFSNETRMFVYLPFADHVLPLPPKNIEQRERYSILQNEQDCKTFRKIIKITRSSSESDYTVWTSADNKRYLIEWRIIPFDEYGFEYYINAPNLKNLKIVLAAMTPLKVITEHKIFQEHFTMLQRQIKYLHILSLIMKFIAGVYIFAQITIILFELKINENISPNGFKDAKL